MSQAEIVARRRKWQPEEKAALLAEVEAEGGRVSVVARRHGISESLIYNWRSAWKAASSLPAPNPVEFVPVGVIGRGSSNQPLALPAPDQASRGSGFRRRRTGMIEIELPNRIRIRIEGAVDEKALSRLLRVMKGVA